MLYIRTPIMLDIYITVSKILSRLTHLSSTIHRKSTQSLPLLLSSSWRFGGRVPFVTAVNFKIDGEFKICFRNAMKKLKKLLRELSCIVIHSGDECKSPVKIIVLGRIKWWWINYCKSFGILSCKTNKIAKRNIEHQSTSSRSCKG